MVFGKLVVAVEDIQVIVKEEEIPHCLVSELVFVNDIANQDIRLVPRNPGADCVQMLLAKPLQDFHIDDRRSCLLPLLPGFDIVQELDEPFIREGDIRKLQGLLEQRSHILVLESGYAATDSGKQKSIHRMLTGVFYEVIDIGFDGRQRSVHRRDCVALALRSNSVAPLCAKMVVGVACRSTHVLAFQIAAENEYLTL